VKKRGNKKKRQGDAPARFQQKYVQGRRREESLEKRKSGGTCFKRGLSSLSAGAKKGDTAEEGP